MLSQVASGATSWGGGVCCNYMVTFNKMASVKNGNLKTVILFLKDLKIFNHLKVLDCFANYMNS